MCPLDQSFNYAVLALLMILSAGYINDLGKYVKISHFMINLLISARIFIKLKFIMIVNVFRFISMILFSLFLFLIFSIFPAISWVDESGFIFSLLFYSCGFVFYMDYLGTCAISFLLSLTYLD